jgi:hypothetical protein
VHGLAAWAQLAAGGPEGSAVPSRERVVVFLCSSSWSGGSLLQEDGKLGSRTRRHRVARPLRTTTGRHQHAACNAKGDFVPRSLDLLPPSLARARRHQGNRKGGAGGRACMAGAAAPATTKKRKGDRELSPPRVAMAWHRHGRAPPPGSSVRHSVGTLHRRRVAVSLHHHVWDGISGSRSRSGTIDSVRRRW